MKKLILNVAEFKPDNSLFAKGGLLEPKDAWDRLSIPEKADIIKVGVKHGIFDLQELRRKYNEFKEGGSKEEEEKVNTIVPYTQRTEVVITPDTEYNQYLNTLPDNQRFTPNDKYDSYFYWKLNGKPKNFEEAYAKGMFNYDHSDNSYHANSIAFDDNTGIGYFMKPKDHDTVGFELDWFNKGLVTEEGGKQRPVTPKEAVELNEFRKNYLLTDDPDRPNYYMYQPIKHSIGGPLVDAANYRDENIYGLGDWLKKGLNWLKNSAQVAAIAESPSVMTAAGHRVTREGKAVQDKQNDPSVSQLRENLFTLGEWGAAAPTLVGDVEAVYQVVRHPVQTAKAVKEAATQGVKTVKQGAKKLKEKVLSKTPVEEWTEQGLSQVTDAQWDAAYKAAIESGNMAEAQRLRDLHFTTNAPNNKLISNEGLPMLQYHGTNATFNVFNPEKIGATTDYGVFGEGFYFTPLKGYARQYGDNIMPVYLNIQKPYIGGDAGGILSTKWKPYNPEEAFNKTYQVMLKRGKSEEDALRIAERHRQQAIDKNARDTAVRGEGYDGIFANTKDINPTEEQYIVFQPNQIKSADAVTYDDAGNIIPLSQRDNFALNDIRYQQTDNLTTGNMPWTDKDKQEAANRVFSWFTEDVAPRAINNRQELLGTRYTENSPYLGRFAFGDLPSSTARGMTTPIIQESKNGIHYVSTMNKNDLSSLGDKIGGMIHEAREDMTNFHKGLYNKDIQNLMMKEKEIAAQLEHATKTGNEFFAQKCQKVLDYIDELKSIAKKEGIISDAITFDEAKILHDAYLIPKKQLVKGSERIEEKIAENTRFREEASRRHGNKVLDELDKEIDSMSEDEVLDILSSGNSYGQDYRNAIEEVIKKNPERKTQMINNIKKAWKKVAVFTGVSSGITDAIIQGHK